MYFYTVTIEHNKLTVIYKDMNNFTCGNCKINQEYARKIEDIRVALGSVRSEEIGIASRRIEKGIRDIVVPENCHSESYAAEKITKLIAWRGNKSSSSGAM